MMNAQVLVSHEDAVAWDQAANAAWIERSLEADGRDALRAVNAGALIREGNFWENDQLFAIWLVSPKCQACFRHTIAAGSRTVEEGPLLLVLLLVLQVDLVLLGAERVRPV